MSHYSFWLTYLNIEITYLHKSKRSIFWNAFSMDNDTSYVSDINISRYLWFEEKACEEREGFTNLSEKTILNLTLREDI